MSARPWTKRGDTAKFLPAPFRPSPPPTPLDGIDMDMLLTAARIGASRSRAGFSLDTSRDIAWNGAVDEWLANDEATFTDLTVSAQRAVSAEHDQWLRHHGLRTRGGGTGERCRMYWEEWQARRTTQPDVTLPIALRQVLDGLPPEQRDILLCSAVHESSAEAAATWGCHVSTWRRKVAAAAESARRTWFDHERPPAASTRTGRRRTATKCVHGHPYSESNTQWVTIHGRRQRRCGACNRERTRRYRERKEITK